MRRMSGTWACSARCDRGAPAAPGAAHTGAARRRPAASTGGSGGRIARAILGCAQAARLAAVVMRSDAPGGWCGPSLGRPAQIRRPQWRPQRRLRRMSGTWACSARCDRCAPGAAHTGAARRRPAASSQQRWQRRSRRTSGTWVCTAATARYDSDAPSEAHTEAALRRSAACRGGSSGHVGRAAVLLHVGVLDLLGSQRVNFLGFIRIPI
jgi:hypothetical protein